MNTWPDGFKCAIDQERHRQWNIGRYPGTRQLCAECCQPTGRCEDDSLNTEIGPVCEECWLLYKPDEE